MSLEAAKTTLPELGGFALLTFSDAHFVDDIGQCTTSFMLEAPSLAEIRMALREESGRKVMGC
jgi:PHP family Zn ribbon phosphoesterase